MQNSTNPAVLIIAYRRAREVDQILQICKANKVKRIYVALDGPKNGNISGLEDNLQIRKIVEGFRKNYFGEVTTLFRDENVGCAASCLSACDWVFENEDYAIVLEDDCIPSNDFFSFAQYSIAAMNADTNIWLACGTQFVPRSEQGESWSLSKYALIWGWITSKNNWKEISRSIHHGNRISKERNISIWERTYWNQGARRAHSGWKDVWDTILLQQMISNGKYSILPNEPLVTNVGDDSAATHTIDKSPWLHLNFGKFTVPHDPPSISYSTDRWLQENFYRISFRHLISTRITLARDYLNATRIPLKPLVERWNFAESNRKTL